MKNSNFVKEQLDIACEALRKIGAVVELCPETMKITVISDSVSLAVTDEHVRLFVDDYEITKAMREMIIRVIPDQFPDMRMVFKPKVSIRRIKK